MPQGSISVLTAWLGCLGYTFQIYFDFSGYSDMAIGLGRMFGFRFPQNFDYPYTSRSITEFWRRWHISLGTWFREYVYIPLGGQPGWPCAPYQKYYDRLVAHGTVARSKLEFRCVGTVLWSYPAGREICASACIEPASRIYFTPVQPVFDFDWLGLFFQPVAFRGDPVSGCHVWAKRSGVCGCRRNLSAAFESISAAPAFPLLYTGCPQMLPPFSGKVWLAENSFSLRYIRTSVFLMFGPPGDGNI